MAAADAATKPLVVFIVFFGELPPWLPLTLTSMAMNARAIRRGRRRGATSLIPQNALRADFVLAMQSRPPSSSRRTCAT